LWLTAPPLAEVYPAKVKYSVDKLEPYYKKISIPKMKAFLTKFSSFRNRYYRSSTGVESQQFLLATIRKIVGANPKLGITVEEFEHPWGQNSILVKIPPAKEVKKDEKIVILSAHQDSTNLLPFLPAPGADDDGSGTTTLITSLAILVNASFVPSTNPVELHFYSAEEGGLLGSAAVAQAYAAAGKKIRGQLQQVSPLPPTTSDSFYFC
jgi:leucyl aminopeptidase